MLHLCPADRSRLRSGDFATLRPGGTKTDFTATIFDNPIYLPWEDDILNAANSLADLEVALPVIGHARTSSPLFPIDEEGTSLDHELADKLFEALTVLALAKKRPIHCHYIVVMYG